MYRREVELLKFVGSRSVVCVRSRSGGVCVLEVGLFRVCVRKVGLSRNGSFARFPPLRAIRLKIFLILLSIFWLDSYELRWLWYFYNNLPVAVKWRLQKFFSVWTGTFYLNKIYENFTLLWLKNFHIGRNFVFRSFQGSFCNAKNFICLQIMYVEKSYAGGFLIFGRRLTVYVHQIYVFRVLRDHCSFLRLCQRCQFSLLSPICAV